MAKHNLHLNVLMLTTGIIKCQHVSEDSKNP